MTTDIGRRATARRPMSRHAAVALLVAAAACSGVGRTGRIHPPATFPGGDTTTSSTSTPDDGLTVVAQAKPGSLAIFDKPGDADPSLSLPSPNDDGAPVVLLVVSQRPGWVEVVLPVAPSGRRGWARTGDVSFSRHDYRMRLELGAHRLTVRKGTDLVVDETVGVNPPAAPPPGDYYLTELLQPRSDKNPYGPFVYGISGYPGLLKSLAAGRDVVAIHGTNDPAGVGKDVTTGSVRLRNDAVTRLAAMLPLGTPLAVEA